MSTKSLTNKSLKKKSLLDSTHMEQQVYTWNRSLKHSYLALKTAEKRSLWSKQRKMSRARWNSVQIHAGSLNLSMSSLLDLSSRKQLLVMPWIWRPKVSNRKSRMKMCLHFHFMVELGWLLKWVPNEKKVHEWYKWSGNWTCDRIWSLLQLTWKANLFPISWDFSLY